MLIGCDRVEGMIRRALVIVQRIDMMNQFRRYTRRETRISHLNNQVEQEGRRQTRGILTFVRRFFGVDR